MPSQKATLFTTISALWSLVPLAHAEEVITVYAPSLRPAPSQQSPTTTDYLVPSDVLNNLFHLGGKIESASAIGYGDGGGKWYVGVHEYSVTVTGTARQFTTITLPTPTSKTGTQSTFTEQYWKLTETSFSDISCKSHRLDLSWGEGRHNIRPEYAGHQAVRRAPV